MSRPVRTAARAGGAPLARRRHPGFAVHRSRAAPDRERRSASARRWSSCIPAPIALPLGQRRAARAGARSRPPPHRRKSSASNAMPATGSVSTRVGPIAAISTIVELNIGHFLVGEAIFGGLDSAVKRMRALMDEAARRRAGTNARVGRRDDPRDRQRPHRHPPHRAHARALWRSFRRPHLHRRGARRSERRANRAASYAKRFAAKEACSKALGTGFRSGVYLARSRRRQPRRRAGRPWC